MVLGKGIIFSSLPGLGNRIKKKMIMPFTKIGKRIEKYFRGLEDTKLLT